MNRILLALLAGGAAGVSLAQPTSTSTSSIQAPTRAGELTLFDTMNYTGDYVIIDDTRTHIRVPWNIRSLGIHPGDRWQLCAQTRFREPCIILDRSVHDARLIGVEGQIGSARLASAIPPQRPD
ncbi:MAG: hypothetical protein ACT4OE_11510 [Sphingosinicella sp.]